jgi:DNA-binding phage protein
MLVNSRLPMPLTRNFKETIQSRVKRDAAFRKELLRESVESFLMGDIETGKAVLRDYINATIGFAELAEVTHHSAKSLMRMLSPSGNPQARNLFEIVDYLQRKERVRFKVAAAART